MTKLLNAFSKRTLIILGAVVITAIAAVALSFIFVSGSMTTFPKGGYVLVEGETNNTKSTQYYFQQEKKYSELSKENISFKDVNNDKVKVKKSSFIHFEDKSLSSFGEGLLTDLATMGNPQPTSYNVPSKVLLQKESSIYTLRNGTEKYKLNSFIYKTGTNEYLFAGQNVSVNIEDGKSVDAGQYVEVKFSDGNIAKIMTQQYTYQTISSAASIIVDGVTIELGNKQVVSGENSFSLDKLLVGFNDDPTIEEENTATFEEGNGAATGAAGAGGNTIVTGGQAGAAGGTSGDGGTAGGSEGGSEGNNIVKLPEFSVEDMKVTPISIDASIKIEDKSSMLSGETKTKIIDRGNGNVVFEATNPYGELVIPVQYEQLKPNSEYTLISSAEYSLDSKPYVKDFITKNFNTDPLGLSLKKDYSTEASIHFRARLVATSQIQTADIVFYNALDQEIGRKAGITAAELVTPGGYDIALDKEQNGAALSSNTLYKARIENVVYAGVAFPFVAELEASGRTLKKPPAIAIPTVQIDKKNNTFIIAGKELTDVDNGLQSVRYEICEILKNPDTLEVTYSEPVKVVDRPTVGEIVINVEPSDTTIAGAIKRGVNYAVQCVAIFNDNEKQVEINSGYSNPFNMGGKDFPAVSIQEENVTFERIEAYINVLDQGGVVLDLSDQRSLNIVMTNSLGVSKTIKFTGWTAGGGGVKSFRIDENGLRAGDTYTFTVLADIDINDGNGEQKQFPLGTAVVTTKLPEIMKASYAFRNIGAPFAVDVKLDANEEGIPVDLEASTLTKLEAVLYKGRAVDERELYTKVKLNDTDAAPYTSILEEQFYRSENGYRISPKTFGLSNSDMPKGIYTLEIRDAADYTDNTTGGRFTTSYNPLPIANNTYTFKTVGFPPALPNDTKDAVSVVPIRQGDVDAKVNDNPWKDDSAIESTTIVGFKVKAIYNNEDDYLRKIHYTFVDNGGSRTDVDVGALSKPEAICKKIEVGVPSGTVEAFRETTVFLEKEGSFTRGKNYYVTYTAELDLNEDGINETSYPQVLDKTAVLSSKVYAAEKQAVAFKMQPVTTTANTMTYKYSFNDPDKGIMGTKFILKQNDTILPNSPVISQEANTDGVSWRTVKFDNLTAGSKETIMVEASLYVAETTKAETTILSTVFEGTPEMNTLEYQLGIEANSLVVQVDVGDSGEKVARIAAYKLKLSADGVDETLIDLCTLDDNGAIRVPLNDIAKFEGKEMKVQLWAYYDTGISGLGSIEENKYYAAQIPNMEILGESESKKYYFYTGNNSISVDGYTAQGSIFKVSLGVATETSPPMTLNLQNAFDTKINTIGNLTYDKSGAQWSSTKSKVTLKELVENETTPYLGRDTIKFTEIAPRVGMFETPTGAISVENIALSTATVAPTIYLQGASALADGDKKVYADIYKGTEHIQTVSAELSTGNTASGQKIKLPLTGLIANTQYKVKLYVHTAYEPSKKTYLYDNVFKRTEIEYLFRTKGHLDVSGISATIKTVEGDYENKNIQVSYSVAGATTGTEKVKHEIYKIVEGQEVKILVDYGSGQAEEINDLFVLQAVNTINVPAGPGSQFDIPGQYIVKITPQTNINVGGEPDWLDLGTTEHRFTLNPLTEPFMLLGSYEGGLAELSFTVAITDTAATIPTQAYKVKLEEIGVGAADGNNIDVTPAGWNSNLNLVSQKNKRFEFKDAKMSKEYLFTVEAEADIYNNKTPKKIAKNIKAMILDKDVITVGDVTASAVNDRPKLFLTKHNKLSEVKFVKCTAYSPTGLPIPMPEVAFNPVISGNSVAVFQFPTTSPTLAKGTYELVLQFSDSNKAVIENCSRTVKFINL